MTQSSVMFSQNSYANISLPLVVLVACPESHQGLDPWVFLDAIGTFRAGLEVDGLLVVCRHVDEGPCLLDGTGRLGRRYGHLDSLGVVMGD